MGRLYARRRSLQFAVSHCRGRKCATWTRCTPWSERNRLSRTMNFALLANLYGLAMTAKQKNRNANASKITENYTIDFQRTNDTKRLNSIQQLGHWKQHTSGTMKVTMKVSDLRRNWSAVYILVDIALSWRTNRRKDGTEMYLHRLIWC